MARIRLIALKQNNNYINLYTSIVEGLGFNKRKKIKLIKHLSIEDNEFYIFEGFYQNKNIDKIKEVISENLEYKIDEYLILFDIEKRARTSFLLSQDDNTVNSQNQILSCFNNNCYLYEYWCINNKIKDIWLGFDENTRKKISDNVEINLFYMIDRVGNVLHFKEIESINFSIFHQNDKFLTFSVAMNKLFIPEKYIASIEVKSFDDVILKESFIIKERFKDFELQDEDYDICIEIYEVDTGRCVFSKNFSYIKEISLNMHVIGEEVVFNDSKGNKIHSIQKYNNQNILTKSKERSSLIVKYQQYRSKFVREYNNFKLLSTFKGFKGQMYKDAEQYFQKLLKKISTTETKYIYIADPYFLSAEFDIRRFINYIDIFATIQDKEVRILTCNEVLPKNLKKFIKNNKSHLFANIKIKSVIELSKRNNKKLSAFHDRWLASEIGEYGFTNSLNNFDKGVSFFKSSKHYFEESENLWNLVPDDKYIIQEYNLYE